MVELLVAYTVDLQAPLTASRIGGYPAVAVDFEWPECDHHVEPMQFMAQIEHDERLLSVFICQFEPGTCESWDPDAGSNAALVFGGRDLVPAAYPSSPHGDPGDPIAASPPIIDRSYLLGLHSVETSAAEDASAVAAAQAEAAGYVVAGQYGGEPDWIQDDETPEGMTFVASIDEGPLRFNFGDAGRAYVFTDGTAAKVLWQAS